METKFHPTTGRVETVLLAGDTRSPEVIASDIISKFIQPGLVDEHAEIELAEAVYGVLEGFPFTIPGNVSINHRPITVTKEG